tara:strand:+ start:798 stop:1154 length:357 start_codon:yes stop_codon:yes gene_type:complete
MDTTELISGSYVYWNAEIRQVHELSDDPAYTWLSGIGSDTNRAYAPTDSLEAIPVDYELLLKSPRDLTDTELSTALDLLENAKLNTSDRPQARKKAHIKTRANAQLYTKETLDFLNSI